MKNPKMIGLFFFIIVFCIFLSCISYAEESGLCGNDATWVLDDQGTLTITGAGEIENGDWFYRDVKSIIINTGVESIGDWTFSGLSFCTDVSIPDTVTQIGEGAFQGCRQLDMVSLPQNLLSIGPYAFSSCDSLMDIHIPSTVQTIGERAFSYNALQNVFIPKSVCYLDHQAIFSKSLLAINVDPENPFYSSIDGVLFNKDQTTLICFPSAKQGQYSIPESVTYIEESAFEFSNIISISIPASTSLIGDYAFLYGNAIETITVSSKNEFYSSQEGVLFNKSKTSLICYPAGRAETSYAIPEGVQSIEDSAFASQSPTAYSLTSLYIPGSIVNIGDCAFYCRNIRNVDYAGSEQQWYRIKWGLEAEKGLPKTIYFLNQAIEIDSNSSGTCGDNATWVLDDQGVLSITGTGEIEKGDWFNREVKTIIINPGIELIGNWTFSSLPFCTSVSMPDTISVIGEGAFSSCSKLNSINLSQNLISINSQAFYACDSLEEINLPDSLQTIDEDSFYSCDALQTIFIPQSVHSLHNQAFIGCKSLTAINVDSDNSNYSSVDGVLFNKDKTILICCPSGKTGQYSVPDSVLSIGKYAIWFSNLSSVSIPQNTISISSRAFEYGRALENITVDSNNGFYSSQDGVLFNKGKTTLICYPGGKKQDSYAIPEGVLNIEANAFTTANSRIPLSTILIPSSITNIGDCAFYGCSTNIVYYAGTQNQWWHINWGMEAEKGLHNVQYLDGAIVLPKQVAIIEDESFRGVHNAEIVIPASVTSISESAFEQDNVIVCPKGCYAEGRCTDLGFIVITN